MFCTFAFKKWGLFEASWILVSYSWPWFFIAPDNYRHVVEIYARDLKTNCGIIAKCFTVKTISSSGKTRVRIVFKGNSTFTFVILASNVNIIKINIQSSLMHSLECNSGSLKATIIPVHGIWTILFSARNYLITSHMKCLSNRDVRCIFRH